MPLRRFAVAACLALAACGGGGSTTPSTPAAQPAPASFSVQIDQLADAQIGAGVVPSLEIGVARNGTVLVDRAYGSRSLDPAVAPDATTDYQIASLTKAFTAACVLLLQQDGKLALDDPLARYVPEYPPGNAITLRRMLNMVSGIPADVNDSFTTLYGPIDRAGVVSRLASHPLDFAPGTRYEYSNANYFLLGIVIERASGMPYDAFVRTRVLAPLGLTRTSYLADWKDADTALGYFHNGVAGGPFVAHPSWSADYLYAMGGLVSDAPDLLRWDEALRAPGLLPAGALAAMFSVPDPSISAYAMGWFVDPDGTAYHDGESGGFNTAHALFPDGYDVVVLGNTWDQYAGHFDPLAVVRAVHAVLPP